MKLSQALALTPGDIVSFVGAGGKTSAMFRLADELVEQGWRIISTTTTQIAEDELHRAPQQVGFGHGMQLPDRLSEQVEKHRHVFVFGKIEADGKVRGVRSNWLNDNLARAAYLDALLVEADGSRRLPMKAPLPHEPVIPTSSTVIVPMMGLRALGKPLDEQHIYGAKIIHNATGYPLGDPVTTRLMAAVIMSPQLSLKNIPPYARITPFLNQVDEHLLPSAREIAAYALTDFNIERVLIGAARQDEPVWETQRRIGAIILAAGSSQRMGQPKMLLPWGSSTIIRTVCERMIDCRLHEVVVVAGEQFEAIQRHLADLPVRVVYNSHHAEGEMLSSLKVGLQTIWHTSGACLIVLGDQPEIETSTFRLVLESYNRGLGRIVAPTYENRRGHPVMIDRTLWPAIAELPPDKVPRDMLQAHESDIHQVAVDTDTILRDIDTQEDYEQARRKSGPLNGA
ncbi:MAG: putative selenium-dependent hydroxylase accessory protein YqeC [Anaerolineae bacterium]|nr:putative selenium-dependent hydroxylase accessory protein YqeC [Anaerolineae bacterium]